MDIACPLAALDLGLGVLSDSGPLNCLCVANKNIWNMNSEITGHNFLRVQNFNNFKVDFNNLSRLDTFIVVETGLDYIFLAVGLLA